MTSKVYYRLESIELMPSGSALTQLKLWLTTVRRICLEILLPELIHEPRVTQFQGNNSETFWEIYDFRTGKTYYCMTENEVLEWLDTRCSR